MLLLETICCEWCRKLNDQLPRKVPACHWESALLLVKNKRYLAVKSGEESAPRSGLQQVRRRVLRNRHHLWSQSQLTDFPRDNLPPDDNEVFATTVDQIKLPPR